MSDEPIKTPISNAEQWHFLFVHRAKVELVCGKVEQSYPTFIHRNIVYRVERKRIRKDEQATVSGLLFVKGDSIGIQRLLDSYFFGIHLGWDCATHQVANIPDHVMQSFMQVSQLNPTRIRFMPHPLGYYATGHTMVKFTSGPLTGMEGFRIRIARDKCLVTTLGGMTIAIGGIHRDSFENADEYVRQRREQLLNTPAESTPKRSAIQEEISTCFLLVENNLDLLVVAASLKPRLLRAWQNVRQKRFDDAVEAAVAVIDEMGSRFSTLLSKFRPADYADLADAARESKEILQAIQSNPDASTDLKELVEEELESLAIRYPEMFAALA